MPKVTIEKERCKGCASCTDACPQQILALSKDINAKGYNYSVNIDQSRCLGCRMCAITCPDVAIEVFVEGTLYQFFTY